MTKDLGNWAERQRLEFVERVLLWRGWINRKDLARTFGVSLPQATNDLVAYATLSGGTCAYNVRSKRYEASEAFEPQLVQPELWGDLRRLAPVLWAHDGVPLVAEPELPVRHAHSGVCQQVARAIFARQALRVRYWSAHAGKVEVRSISPRTFAFDGLRVHVRAFCHRDAAFKDFVLGRIETVLKAFTCPHSDVVDDAWQRFVTLKIVPNPELPEATRKTLARDYGMTRGACSVQVREALLLYTTRRLGFIGAGERPLPLLNEVRELRLTKIDRQL